MADPTALVDALERAGYRKTRPRRTVAALVAEQVGAFTSTSLLEATGARDRSVGRATVFRTLDALAGAGAIERIDLPSGEHAYVGCAPAHHHHVVCARCGRTAEIADAGLRRMAREAERRTGFRIDEHRVEFFGRCPDCMDLD